MLNLENYEKLQSEFENENYSKKYNLIYKFLHVFSYFGHIASIFVGFFFIYKLMYDAAGDELNSIVIATISGLFLTLFEFLKRYTFNLASFEMITKQYKSQNSQIQYLITFSMILVSISFYFGLSGAQRFSDKEGKITNNSEVELLKIDSLVKSKYANELQIINVRLTSVQKERDQILKEVENINKSIDKLSNKKLNEENSQIQSTIQNQINNEISRRDKLKMDADNIIKNISADKDSLQKKIDLDKKPMVDKLNLSILEKQKTNTDSSLKFIFVVAFIETMILIGIYFANVYRFNSYKELKTNVKSDVKYQQYVWVEKLILFVYQSGTLKVGDKSVSSKNVFNLAQMQYPKLTEKNVQDLFSVLVYLNILTPNSNYRTINVDMEEAKEILKKHFLN